MANREEEGGGLRFIKNAEGMIVAVILAIVLWVGNTTYNNSLILTKVATQIERYQSEQDRIDKHLSTIWPRLREMKERIQHLETLTNNDRATNPWLY